MSEGTGDPRFVDRRVLEPLLQSALGIQGSLVEWHIIRASRHYAVVDATLSEPSLRVVVKLAGPEAALPCTFERTAAINRLVRARTQVPTFEVLAVDVSYQVWPWRYLVMTHMAGATWAAAQADAGAEGMRAVRRQLGQVAAELQTLRFPACGELDAMGNVAQGTPYVRALAARARRRIANRRHADRFVSLLQERSALFGAMDEGALCHEDLNPNNILLAETDGHWRIAAILDFDSAWSGNAESDLARLELWRGMTDAGFHEEYRAIVPMAAGYQERRPVHQLLWCLEYASVTPRHLADTAALCAELDIPAVSL